MGRRVTFTDVTPVGERPIASVTSNVDNGSSRNPSPLMATTSTRR
jgi:hypothetical protein